MPFIGNQLSTSFQNVETQTITGDGSTGYTLNNPVADGKDLLVYINNVKQEEGSGKAYTATGTTITFSDAVASTDSCYVVFIGQAIGTVTPKDGSIVSSMLADANLEMPNTLDLNGKELILDADADTSITADTDDQIDIKIAGSDNLRIKANEIENVSGDLEIDVAGDIILDADGADIILKDGGSSFGRFVNSSTDFIIQSDTPDKDIIFKGNDNNSMIEAMRIDMSEGGKFGIGTTSPQRALSIGTHGSTSSAEIAFGTTTTGNASLLFGDSTSGTALYDGYIQYQHDGNNMLFATGGGSERMRLDSSGNLLVAKTSNDSGSAVGAILGSAGVSRFTADGTHPVVVKRKSNDGDIIQIEKDSTIVGRIKTFNSTVQYGGAAAAIYLDTAAFLPANASGRTDNTIDLGNSSFRYDDVFATNGTIQTSDQNEKQDIADLTAKELNVANKLSALFKTYRWKDAVVEKSDKARTHSGIIAQDIQSAFSAEGLDASNYGMFMSDTWTNDDGKEQTRLGVRYPELFSFIFSSIEARLTALEAK